MDNKVFINIEEAAEYLFSEQVEADLLAIPPEVDALTDDEICDNELTETPHVPDIAGFVEVLPIILANDAIEEITENTVTEPQPKKSKNTIKSKLTKSKVPKEDSHKWSMIYPKFNFELFECFFTQDVFDMILQETIRYATELKNKQGYMITVEEIKTFIGLIVFTGYHTLPSQRNYWSDDEDLGIPLVKKAFNRNKYLELKSVIHFRDNKKANENKHDKCFKVRLLFDKIRCNFQSFGVFHQTLSIVEIIIHYYGNHFLKQFIKGKPIRFGYKIWAMSGIDGYCNNFSLYCGKEPQSYDKTHGPLGEKVVLDMLSVVDSPSQHKEKGFMASGTIRNDRTRNCPLISTKEIEKKDRGYYEFKFDEKNEISVIRWNGNRSVSTNFDHPEPCSKARQYCKRKRQIVHVDPPAIINNYAKFMGGVDEHAWLLEKHTVAVIGKECTSAYLQE